MPPPITSLHNVRIKEAIKLRDRKGRDNQARLIVDGEREILRGLQAGLQQCELYFCDHILDAQTQHHVLIGDILDLAEKQGHELVPVSATVMHKMAFGDRVQGMVLTAAQLPLSLEAFQPRTSPRPLIAVVEGIEKPGNLGAILRSADAAGLSGVMVGSGGTDLFNPNAIRASLGTLFSMPICKAESAEILAWLDGRKYRIFAARVDGASPYASADFTGSTALVLGSEAEGLSATWTGKSVTGICLPMRGIADSLNVSVTAAVLFYEALRQREPGL